MDPMLTNLTLMIDMNTPSLGLQSDLDLLCIRHGRSILNQCELQFFKKYPHLRYPEAETHPQLRDNMLFSQKFIDTDLCSHGIKECLALRDDHTLSHVPLVLVSPLNRALMTANLIFGEKPSRILVHPLLAESVRYSCDLICPIEAKVNKFRNFDFSLMEGLGPHWYIENNLGPRNVAVFRRQMRQLGSVSLEEQQKVICKLIREGVLYESNEELRERTDRMRNNLIDYRKEYDKICVISHQWILSYLTTSQFDEHNCPRVTSPIRNAFPYWFSLAKLLLK